MTEQNPRNIPVTPQVSPTSPQAPLGTPTPTTQLQSAPPPFNQGDASKLLQDVENIKSEIKKINGIVWGGFIALVFVVALGILQIGATVAQTWQEKSASYNDLVNKINDLKIQLLLQQNDKSKKNVPR